MQRDLIKIMKETEKLKLSFRQIVNHYFIVVFLLLIPLFMMISIFEIYITKTYDGVRSVDELIRFIIPCIVLAIIFFFIQKNRLKFKKIKIDYTDEDFKEAVNRTVKDLEWKIDKNNKTYLRAFRPWNWTGSWGEMITIIKLNDGLLVNSICDPDKWTSVASYGWNKKNIRTFLNNLSDTKKGIDFKEIIEKPENEWTLKRIAVRLLMYPLCLGLIAVGLYVILNPVDWKSQGAGIAVIGFASYYLYIDIKLIRKQNKARKPNTRYSK